MAAGIEIYNYVTNQKGSPAIYSDTLANRPAAGFIGRLFVSTDTLEIYRDNGTTWDLISGGSGPAVNIYNSDGSLTAARTMTMANHNLTFEGGANPARLIISANNNVARIFSFRTAGSQRWAFRVDDNETGSNAGGNWYLRAYDDAGTFTISPLSVERASGEKSMLAVETLSVGSANLTGLFNVAGATYQAGLTMTGGNPHGASHNNFTLANVGNITFANSIYLGAQSNVLRLQANNSGTITLNAASPGIRTAAATLNQVQYNTSTGAALTYTHASVMQTLGFYRLVAAGSLTITNAYGLIINNLNEYGYAATGAGALALTNRWGIYQDSTTDVNYLGGTTLIGTTTNPGEKLYVNGSIRIANGGRLRGDVYVGSYLQIDNDTIIAANRDILFISSAERMRITSAGNIGIGTSSPLNVANYIGTTTNGTSGSWHLLAQGGTNKAIFETGGSVTQLKTLVSEPLLLGTNNTERLRITASGDVGIGTASPLSILSVAQNSDGFTAGITITRSGATRGTIFLDTTNDTFNFTRGNIAGSGLTIASNGNVLIGSTTNPGAKLYVNGVTYINNTSSAGDYYLQVGGAIYATNNSVSLSIATQNNRFIAGEYGVGIGTSSFDASQTNCVNVRSGTAPGTNIADVFVMYSADITAGNAAPHFRTENGNVIKIYQETTGVAASAFTANTGTAVNDASTFDGYTLKQVVKALRNLGILA